MTYDVQIEDVPYLTVDGEALLARLYRPKGGGPFPALVEVHGGAWTSNDRMTNVDICRPLAEAGAVVMSIDFRMPPAVQYPAPIAEINFATRWLKARAAEFGSSPERVGILGTSSGGHQAMLSALRPKDPRYAALPSEGGHDASVAFAVLCWPIVDPLARYKMVSTNGNDRLKAAHDAYWLDEAAMAEGNPQAILAAYEGLRPLPPMLYLQGTDDSNVTPNMATNFRDAYTSAGGAITLETFDGAPHAFVARDPESADSKQAVALIRDFVLAQ